MHGPRGTPLGCRVYYCDPGYQSAAPSSRTFIARLKHLADHHGLPWNYAPLHRHLHDRRRPTAFRDDRDLAAADPPDRGSCPEECSTGIVKTLKGAMAGFCLTLL